ncbi:hypothetical protein POTOM_025141 [Populus tomentosa]|uniref:Uncharacterized protein n=1 Tax=Populus tomentosa TaxID=118781 RepID=A0A8X7ZKM9_POPTO|nr:hypothetical protein POTOM_025141 [Populus tomentosa]
MLNTVSLPFVYVVVSHKKANMVTNHEAGASSAAKPTNSGHVFAAGFDPNPYIPKTCQNQSIHKWKT